MRSVSPEGGWTPSNVPSPRGEGGLSDPSSVGEGNKTLGFLHLNIGFF